MGEYRIGLLPVGSYELTVTAPGMRALKDANVQVSLGENTIANFSLDTAEAAATVEILSSSTAPDITQVNSVKAVDSKLVEVLPLAGERDFTALAQLTPGAVYDSDNDRVSVEGARGIQNNLTIDGASYQPNFFGEQRGSTRIPFAFWAETIKELQVITNAFDAQYFPIYWGIQGAVNFSYTSGRPYSSFNANRTIAGVTNSGDLNGDGATNDDSPNTQRNQFRQPSVRTLDLRLNRDFKIARRFEIQTFVDVVNGLNWANQRTTLTTRTQGNNTVGYVPVADFGYINLPDRNPREVQLGVRAKF